MIPFPADQIHNLDAAFAWWERFACECEELDSHVSASTLTRKILSSFRDILNRDLNQELTLEEAARRSGYHAGHLGRLLRQGKLLNAGRKYAPRIRAGDLPKRAKNLAPPTIERYDPIADARSLRSRREETPNGDSHTETF